MNKVDIQEKMSVMNPSDSNSYANSLMQEGFANKEMDKSEVKVVDEDKKEKNNEHKKEEENKKEEIKQKFTNGSTAEESVTISASQAQLNEFKSENDDLEPFTNPYSSYSRY